MRRVTLWGWWAAGRCICRGCARLGFERVGALPKTQPSSNIALPETSPLCSFLLANLPQTSSSFPTHLPWRTLNFVVTAPTLDSIRYQIRTFRPFA